MKRFVSASHRHATLDKRTLSHFVPEETDSAIEEATSLLVLVETESDAAEIRELIGVSERERQIAEFFCAASVVSEILGFREKVMQLFDEGLAEKRKAEFNRLVAEGTE